MHFNFDYSVTQILWTLTFAATLVLLVVLLGRGRAKRFPWFTASIATTALILLTEQLLLSRLPHMTGSEIYWTLSSLDVVIGLLVLVELARRSFPGLGKLGWIIGTLAMLAVGAAVLVKLGPWPAWKTLTATSELETLLVMQLVADKGTLLSSVLAIELGLVITLRGRRFGAGWHSHAQRITIGLSTAALGHLTVHGTLQAIGLHTVITPSNYDRVIGVRDKLIHGNNVLFLCVTAWWIASLWIDEPGTASEVPEETASSDEGEAAPPEAQSDGDDEAESPEALEAVENPEPQNESSGTHAQN
jgi:hypothetical protein